MKILCVAHIPKAEANTNLLFPIGHAFHNDVRKTTDQIDRVLAKIKKDEMTELNKLYSIAIDEQIYYVKQDQENIYLISTSEKMHKSLAATMLTRLHVNIAKKDHSDIQTFVTMLENMHDDYQKKQSEFDEKVEAVQNLLDDTKKQMHKNLDNVIERGEKLSELVARTEKLKDTPVQFKTGAFLKAFKKNSASLFPFFRWENSREEEKQPNANNNSARKK